MITSLPGPQTGTAELPPNQLDARNISGTAFFEALWTFPPPSRGSFEETVDSPEGRSVEPTIPGGDAGLPGRLWDPDFFDAPIGKFPSAGFDPNIASVPSEVERLLPAVRVDLNPIRSRFAADRGSLFKTYTVGLESYSILRYDGFKESRRSLLAVTVPELRTTSNERFLCTFPNDAGQGLAGAVALSFPEELPAQLTFQVGILNAADPNDTKLYYPNLTRFTGDMLYDPSHLNQYAFYPYSIDKITDADPAKEAQLRLAALAALQVKDCPFWHQRVRQVQIRLFVKVQFEFNRKPIFGPSAASQSTQMMGPSGMAQESQEQSTDEVLQSYLGTFSGPYGPLNFNPSMAPTLGFGGQGQPPAAQLRASTGQAAGTRQAMTLLNALEGGFQSRSGTLTSAASLGASGPGAAGSLESLLSGN